MNTTANEVFEGTGGLNLRMRSWHPAFGTKVRAALVVVHGFKSHSGHYEGAGKKLAEQGFAVYALDLRGHGESEGERLFVEKFGDYVEDVKRLVEIAKAREPGVPVFVLGHSAGGVIASSYALDNQGAIAGLISESFAHEVPAPAAVLGIVKGISHLFPRLHVLSLKNEQFSRDQAWVDGMTNDPLIPSWGYPAYTVAEMERANERLRREYGNFKLPVLIMHGTEDHTTMPSGSKRFSENVGSADKTLRLYEGHYHDLLNDFGKEEVLNDLVSWMNARLAN